MKEHNILDLVPQGNSTEIPWDKIEASPFSKYIGPLIESKQNKFYHGEGNAWEHTKRVVEELLKLDEYQALEQDQKNILFLSALLHDIGKANSTKLINGKWSAPKHASNGSKLVRDLLWRDFGLNGTEEDIKLRETISLLTKYHFLPLYINERKNPELDLARIASNQELLPDFSIKNLCLLEEADMKGRITPVLPESLEQIEECRKLAKEIGCYEHPLEFEDKTEEFLYLQGKDKNEETWGDVVLMAGLPASGKDTWIKKHYSDYPVISLDDIREEINFPHRGNQKPVVDLAYKRAKEYLENKVPFVWNATNLNSKYRTNLLKFIHNHNARTKIDYLETDRDEELTRNENREATVPVSAINQMLKNMSIPERFEATEVSYNVT